MCLHPIQIYTTNTHIFAVFVRTKEKKKIPKYINKHYQKKRQFFLYILLLCVPQTHDKTSKEFIFYKKKIRKERRSKYIKKKHNKHNDDNEKRHTRKK